MNFGFISPPTRRCDIYGASIQWNVQYCDKNTITARKTAVSTNIDTFSRPICIIIFFAWPSIFVQILV